MWNKIRNVCAGVASPSTAATPSHRQLQVAIKGPSRLPAAPLLHRPQHAGWTNATGEAVPRMRSSLSRTHLGLTTFQESQSTAECSVAWCRCETVILYGEARHPLLLFVSTTGHTQPPVPTCRNFNASVNQRRSGLCQCR